MHEVFIKFEKNNVFKLIIYNCFNNNNNNNYTVSCDTIFNGIQIFKMFKMRKELC
jgi:hypothetical protein